MFTDDSMQFTVNVQDLLEGRNRGTAAGFQRTFLHDDIVKMCDDLIEAHGDMLPKYI